MAGNREVSFISSPGQFGILAEAGKRRLSFYATLKHGKREMAAGFGCVRMELSPLSMSRFVIVLLTLTTLAACAPDDNLGKGLQDVGPGADDSSSSVMQVEP